MTHVLLAFLTMACGDYAWACYVSGTAQARPHRAAGWAVLLYVIGAVNVVAYVSDPWLVLPGALGAYVGTWVAVNAERGE